MNAKKIHTMGAAMLILLSLSVFCGCSPKIQGWSQESFRDPDFQHQAILEGDMAIFPVMILEAPGEKPGKFVEIAPPAPYARDVTQLEISGDQKTSDPQEVYRIILNEMLLDNLQKRNLSQQMVTPGDVLKRINDRGLSPAYEKFIQDFPRIGLNGDQIKKFGEALGCRYLLISQGVVTEYKSEASYTLVWSFGRKSTLRTVKISSQIWDTRDGSHIWEGSGVGYNQLSLYEGAPLLEEMADQAVNRLLDAMIPTLSDQ
ncbi:MAG: hypothetical protein AB7S77_18655 [Desulfatirhabdiaceae bacterium]